MRHPLLELRSRCVHAIMGPSGVGKTSIMEVIALRRRLLDGEVIYLHCRGGHGRTGTVAIPLLASVFGAPTEAVHAPRARVRVCR